METKFNFNSQVCTSRSQSEKLLALGLKKETADMVYQYLNQWDGWYLHPLEEEEGIIHTDIPAWSLHRLIEMMPKALKREYGYIYWIMEDNTISYADIMYGYEYTKMYEFIGDSIYESVILAIEWLIKEGYFNKEFLEE